MDKIGLIAQLVVGFGILNVWLLRPQKATAYRGAEARNMREEFAVYGFPLWFMCVIGTLKVSLALALIAGVWAPRLVSPAAVAMAVLMLGAVVMHIKVRDPLKKAMPAIAMLLLSVVAAIF